MDNRVNCVGSLLKYIKLKNPQETPTRPTWSLNKVLSHLDTLDVSIEFNLLRKTAFLLLLATGWRISELHACVRDQEHCRFTSTQSLVLRPHKSFIAKNGHRNRLKPKEISTLKDKEGNTSNICPVTSLKKYLDLNRDCNTSLFIHTKFDKELTVNGLRSAICSVIRDAEPEAKAKAHDIRKMSASLSLLRDMNIGDLTEEFNWSSSAVFYKHYFMAMNLPDRPIAVPGREY